MVAEPTRGPGPEEGKGPQETGRGSDPGQEHGGELGGTGGPKGNGKARRSRPRPARKEKAAPKAKGTSRVANGEDGADRVISSDKTRPEPLRSQTLEGVAARRGLSFDQLEARAVSWLWRPYLPAGLVALLAGQAATGKSTVATAIVAALTTGRALPGDQPRAPMNVLWFSSEEDHRSIIRPRLLAAGADTARVFSGDLCDDREPGRRLRLPSDAAQVVELVRRFKAALVVYDPVSGFLDLNRGPETGELVREVMEACAHVGRQTGAALVAIKHPRKGSSGDAIERVSGSQEWTNVPRTVLLTARCPIDDGLHVLAPLKCSLTGKPPSQRFALVAGEQAVRIEWKGESADTAEEVLATAADPVERSVLTQALAIIRDQLGTGPKLGKVVFQLGEDNGVSKRTMSRAKKELGVESYPDGSHDARVWYWRLPAGGSSG